MTLIEGQGHRIEKRSYRPIVGLPSQQRRMGIAGSASEIIKHLV